MIPKIIHYTWFSDEPYPLYIKECIESWQKHMPEYEFVLWDSNKILNIENLFMQQAIFEKKWAFASDFVRLFAVYNYGGIYLDTDVFVCKSFNELLVHNCFIGRESSFHLVGREICTFLSSHCFGAEPKNGFIKKCLDYYDGRSFLLSKNKELKNELRLDLTLLPYIQAMIAIELGWNWSHKNNSKIVTKELTVFPSYYFDPMKINSKSFCKHLALGNWRESWTQQEKITLKYKIEWRIIKVLEKILWKFSYIIIKVK